MSEEPQMLPAWDLREYPLSFECTNDLSLHLDPENPLAYDWRMLAVNLGYDESIFISSLERHKSPTESVLRMYVTQCEWPTWQGLQYALRNMERADVEHKLVQHAGKLGLSSEAAKEGLPIGWDKPANLKRDLNVHKFSHTCINELSKLLLLDHPLSKDWKLLASILKYSNSDIEQFGRNRNPAFSLLQNFQCKPGATLVEFYNALVDMPRYDVIYALWKLNELTTEVESNTVNPNQPTVQSLPPGANRPTVRQTARQTSEQNPRTQPPVGKPRNPTRQHTSFESVIDKLKQLGIDESKARTAVLEASRDTGIEDTEDLLDEALEIINELGEEYDGAGRDFQMSPMQSMPAVMNITGGNVQIGSHNRIIYTEKPSQRAPKTKASGNTKQRDRGTSRQESKQVSQANPSAARRKSDALRILGIPEEDIKRLIATNPELNENELANLYFQGIESLQKRPIPSERAHPDVPQYVDQREIPDQNIHGSIPETHPMEQTRLQNQDAERQRCLEIDRGAKGKTRENPVDQNIQPTPQGPSQSQKAHSPSDINEEIAKKISRQPVAPHLQARGNPDGGVTPDVTRSNIVPRGNQAKPGDGNQSKPPKGSTAQKVPKPTSTTGAVPKVKFEDNAPGDCDGRKPTTASGPTAKMPSVVVPDSSFISEPKSGDSNSSVASPEAEGIQPVTDRRRDDTAVAEQKSMKRHTEIPEAVYTNVVDEEVKETSPDDSFDKLESPDPQQEQVPLAPDCPTGKFGPVQAAQSQDYVKQGHGGIKSGGDTPTVTGESDSQNNNASVGAGGGDGSATNGNDGDFDLDLRSREPSMDAANSERPEQRLPGQDEPTVTKSEDSSQAAMPSLQESNNGREDAAVADDEQSGGSIAALRNPSDDQSESERKDEEQERSEQSGQPDKQQRQDDNGSAVATASTLNTLETGVYVLTSADIEQITKGKSKLISNEGAFGPVYEGEFIYEGPLKGSRVAVKILDTSGTHGEREYKREKSVAGIKHPNILPVFGVCEDEGHPMCIVYPYMENRDLAYQISQKNPALTWQRRIVIAICLCRAVLYLHLPTGDRKIKVYHRDIKSANVLLNGSWWPYLGDTGLTREIAMEKTHLSQTGSQLCVSGTRGYQDPVLIMKPANYYDDFCDIYSLGKVLLELLTNVLAQETDDENKDYVHSQWLEDEILEDLDALSSIAVKSSVGWPQLEENEVAKEFAKVVISCLRTARKKRAKLPDICQKLEALAAANNIPLCVDTETKMCAICLRNHTAPVPLSCGCKIACDECLKSYRTNAIKCPCHGATEPQSIHKEGTGTQSTIEEMDEP